MILASGLRPYRSTVRSLATTVAAAPSVMPGALPAVTVPIVASPRSPEAWLGSSKAGFRRASASSVESRPFVDGHDRLAALRVADRDGRDLGIQPAGVDGGDRLLMARQGEGVL